MHKYFWYSRCISKLNKDRFGHHYCTFRKVRLDTSHSVTILSVTYILYVAAATLKVIAIDTPRIYNGVNIRLKIKTSARKL